VSERPYTEEKIKTLWRDVANWRWDPKTHGIGQLLAVPVLQEPDPTRPLAALDQLEFRFVPAGTDGLARNSIVCEGVVVADETNFAWITRPYEFFTTRRREDGSHDVYRINRSPAGDLIYCATYQPVTANSTEERTVTGHWPIQQFLDRNDVPALAKGIIRDLCGRDLPKADPEQY
jgi:hypothetical protein